MSQLDKLKIDPHTGYTDFNPTKSEEPATQGGEEGDEDNLLALAEVEELRGRVGVAEGEVERLREELRRRREDVEEKRRRMQKANKARLVEVEREHRKEVEMEKEGRRREGREWVHRLEKLEVGPGREGELKRQLVGRERVVGQLQEQGVTYRRLLATMEEGLQRALAELEQERSRRSGEEQEVERLRQERLSVQYRVVWLEERSRRLAEQFEARMGEAEHGLRGAVHSVIQSYREQEGEVGGVMSRRGTGQSALQDQYSQEESRQGDVIKDIISAIRELPQPPEVQQSEIIDLDEDDEVEMEDTLDMFETLKESNVVEMEQESAVEVEHVPEYDPEDISTVPVEPLSFTSALEELDMLDFS